jgi:hypothetical protein
MRNDSSICIILRGSATVGHSLTAGIFDNNGLSLTGVTIHYQWQCSVNGSWINIVGETAQSLTLRAAGASIGKLLRFVGQQ